MTIQLSNRQALALRKAATPLLRKHGIANPEDHSLHSLSWRGLNDLEADLKREARSVLDDMKDGTPEEKLRALEDAHDGMMAIFDAITAEKDVRSASGDRGPRSSATHPHAPIPADGVTSAIAGRDHYGDIGEASTSLRSNQSMADWVAETRGTDLRDYRGLTTGSFLRAMILGPSNDMEKRALSEGTDSAGGYTVPDILSARLIDRMRAASTVIRAGAQTVPLGSDVNYVAKLLTDPSPAWRAENGAIAESDPTFGRVTMTPRSLGVIVKVSRELLEDSVNIGSALPTVIANAMAAELDRVALLGSGTAPEPRGVANFTSKTANSFAGGELGYADLVKARTALRSVNADVSAFIMHPRDEGQLVEAVDSTGQPITIPPVIASIPMLTTTKIATNGGVGTNESKVFAGDFSKLLIGVRHSLRIEVLKERYADTNQYAFVAVLRADVAAEHEAAFTVLSGVTT